MGWLRLLTRKFVTVANLSATERSLLLQALLLLPLVALALQVVGFQKTQALLKRIPEQATLPLPPEISSQPWITVKMVQRAARYQPWWANCLKQSLVLWLLLRRQGILSDLRIGVQQSAGKFAAHAWVEYEGVALNESPDVDRFYIPFQHSF